MYYVPYTGTALYEERYKICHCTKYINLRNKMVFFSFYYLLHFSYLLLAAKTRKFVQQICYKIISSKCEIQIE